MHLLLGNCKIAVLLPFHMSPGGESPKQQVSSRFDCRLSWKTAVDSLGSHDSLAWIRSRSCVCSEQGNHQSHILHRVSHGFEEHLTVHNGALKHSQLGASVVTGNASRTILCYWWQNALRRIQEESALWYCSPPHHVYLIRTLTSPRRPELVVCWG